MSGVSTLPSAVVPGDTPPLPDDERGESILDRAYAKLGAIIDEIVILRVTTVVGTVTATGAGDVGEPTVITIAPEGQLVAHSAINTALGDMNVVLSKGFLDDAALMELHKQALADSRAIRRDAIELLRSAIQMIAGRLGA